MAKLMSKSELIQKIAEQHASNMTRKDVKGVIESLAEIGYKELKRAGGFLRCFASCATCCASRISRACAM
jgi:DNA-binding protein HU-beta